MELGVTENRYEHEIKETFLEKVLLPMLLPHVDPNDEEEVDEAMELLRNLDWVAEPVENSDPPKMSIVVTGFVRPFEEGYEEDTYMSQALQQIERLYGALDYKFNVKTMATETEVEPNVTITGGNL